MTTSYLKRVQAGADFLDRNVSGRDWWRVIDLDTFDVRNEYHCILAQLYGSYSEGEERMSDRDGFDVVEMGFDVSLDEDMDKAYYWLQRRWTQEIEARRAA